MEKYDYCERREAVVKSVIELFSQKGEIDPAVYKTRQYTLWIEANKDVYDGLIKANDINLTLINELTDELYTNEGVVLGSLKIDQGKPEGNHEHIKKMEVADVIMYLEEKALVTTPISAQSPVLKARITLASGSPRDGLVKPKGYIINSKDVPYNIGRIIKPGGKTGINRKNDIEIIEEIKEVSRIHAHIDFDDKGGFFIQKDENPKGTNLTVVMRKGDDDFELRGSAIRYLRDGDIIVLRNTVWLAFHLVK